MSSDRAAKALAQRSARAGIPSENVPRTFAVITTHTPRHLLACLAGAGWQRPGLDGVVVSSDRVDPAIAEVVQAAAPTLGTPALLAWREHAGVSRQAQVRNNGVRAAMDRWRLDDSDLVLFLDGDIVLAPDAAGRHALAHEDGAGLTLGFRAELTATQTAVAAPQIADDAGGDGAGAVFDRLWPANADAALAVRARRYRRALLLARLGGRGLGLVKRHKPKVISCHVGVGVGLLRAINGFDEAYEGHGFEDDDLGLRAYRTKPPARAAVLVDSARALHLWHPTRKIGDVADSPQAQRFRRPRPTVFAEAGLDSPRPQAPVEIMAFGKGAS